MEWGNTRGRDAWLESGYTSSLMPQTDRTTRSAAPVPYAAVARPTHVRYAVMGFLCVLSFLTYFDRVCIMRVQENVQHDLSINDRQMGWVFSAFWLAYALFEIPGGWWGDRFGARRTLTRVVLAWSLFTALSGCATGFLSLLTFRFLFGVGEAGAYPNIARVQSRWLPADAQARAGGLLWLVARWGGALSPILFGSLLRLFDSPGMRSLLGHLPMLGFLGRLPAWRLGFVASGLAGIGWVALFYPWFRDEPADKPSVNAAELELLRSGQQLKREASAHRGDARIWPALFSSPSLWALAMLYVFGSFGWSFFVTWMPKYLLQAHNIEYAKSEWMSSLPLLCGGAACLAGGWLSDWVVRITGRKRFGRAVFLIGGRIIAAAAIFAVPHVHTAHQAVALMCITMAAFDLGQGPAWAAIIEVGGAYAGLAAGFVNTLGNFGGNFVQPIVGAQIFSRFGWPTLFAVYAASYLLSGAMWLFINPERRFYREADPSRGFEVVAPRKG
ncbi:MAG: major facilitator superfamily 1 [Phycisphaerales bacterium]|nr:major facilitator superfamily 1 [Phycisphaerales bacterium]